METPDLLRLLDEYCCALVRTPRMTRELQEGMTPDADAALRRSVTDHCTESAHALLTKALRCCRYEPRLAGALRRSALRYPGWLSRVDVVEGARLEDALQSRWKQRHQFSRRARTSGRSGARGSRRKKH